MGSTNPVAMLADGPLALFPEKMIRKKGPA
jgi:hypothetical protein